MVRYNALTINGWSTADLPFYVAVIEMPGLTMARKKDKHYNQSFSNSVTTQSVDAWETVEQMFVFYLHDADRYNLREFKALFKNQGEFMRYDDDLMTKYVSLELTSSPMDEYNGYQVDVTFVCEPFEYEPEYEIQLGDSLLNRTSAPMYPRITCDINSTEQTYLTIGPQTMYFNLESVETVVIECKHGYQDVTNTYGAKLNSEVRGGFFEIKPGQHGVEMGPGITNVKMLTRWGWL